MNTQDTTPGFRVLPPLPAASAGLSKKRLESTRHGTVRLDAETADAAFLEFAARVYAYVL